MSDKNDLGLMGLTKRQIAAVAKQDAEAGKLREEAAVSVVVKSMGSGKREHVSEAELRKLFPDLYVEDTLKNLKPGVGANESSENSDVVDDDASRVGLRTATGLRSAGSDGAFLTEVFALNLDGLSDEEDESAGGAGALPVVGEAAGAEAEAEGAVPSEAQGREDEDEDDKEEIYEPGDPRGVLFVFGEPPPLDINPQTHLASAVGQIKMGCSHRGVKAEMWERTARRALKELCARPQTERLVEDSIWLAHCRLWQEKGTHAVQEQLLNRMACNYWEILGGCTGNEWHLKSGTFASMLYPYVLAWTACEALLDVFNGLEGVRNPKVAEETNLRVSGMRRGRVCDTVLSAFCGRGMMWQFHVAQFKRAFGRNQHIIGLATYARVERRIEPGPQVVRPKQTPSKYVKRGNMPESNFIPELQMNPSHQLLLASELHKARKRERNSHLHTNRREEFSVLHRMEESDLGVSVTWSQAAHRVSTSNNIQKRFIDANELSPLVARYLRLQGSADTIAGDHAQIAVSEVVESQRKNGAILDFTKEDVLNAHAAIMAAYQQGKELSMEKRAKNINKLKEAIGDVSLEEKVLVHSNLNEVHRFSGELIAEQRQSDEKAWQMQNSASIAAESELIVGDTLPTIKNISAVMYQPNWEPLTNIAPVLEHSKNIPARAPAKWS